jgi:hypothetical protein
MSTTIDPVGSVTGRPAPIASGHRLLDQEHPPRPRALGRFLDRAPLDRGRPRRHADDHARAREAAAIVHFANEVLDHLLGDFEVGDHAVAQRPDRLDVAGRAADHLLRFLADREDLLAPAIDGDRDHRRLVQHDALALDVHQRIGCAEVDRHVGRQQAKQSREHEHGFRG